MLHEYDMYVTCMSKMDGFSAGIVNAHMQTCMGHACSSIHVYMYYGNMMPHACSIHDAHT